MKRQGSGFRGDLQEAGSRERLPERSSSPVINMQVESPDAVTSVVGQAVGEIVAAGYELHP